MNKKNNKKAATIKEVLIAARWILDNIGWCQGSYTKTKSGKPSVLTPITLHSDNIGDISDISAACLRGAVWLVETKNHLLSDETFDFIQFKIENKYAQSMTSWNDDPKRTKNQVLSLLDKIIEEA
jgi:hypothetical protein